jgi:hypothetical protein
MREERKRMAEQTVDEQIVSAENEAGIDPDDDSQPLPDEDEKPKEEAPKGDEREPQDIFAAVLPKEKLPKFFQNLPRDVTVNDLIVSAQGAGSKIREHADREKLATERNQVLEEAVRVLTQRLAQQPVAKRSLRDVLPDPSGVAATDPERFGEATADYARRGVVEEILPRIQQIEQKFQETEQNQRQREMLNQVAAASEAARRIASQRGGRDIPREEWEEKSAWFSGRVAAYGSPFEPESWDGAYQEYDMKHRSAAPRTKLPQEGIIRGNPRGATAGAQQPMKNALKPRVRGMVSDTVGIGAKYGLTPEEIASVSEEIELGLRGLEK